MPKIGDNRRTRCEVSGETYPVRTELKDLGFQWDGDERVWWKMVEDEDIDDLAEAVSDLEDVEFKVCTD